LYLKNGKLKQKKANSKYFQAFLGISVKNQQKPTAKQFKKKQTFHEVANKEDMIFKKN